MAEDSAAGNELPIEEIGLDLVVNADDNFVSTMKAAGDQFDVFSAQAANLGKNLPALNEALAGISSALFNINNRVSSTAKISEALKNLSKVPADLNKMRDRATAASTAIDTLMVNLGKSQKKYQEVLKAKRDFEGSEGAAAAKARAVAQEGKAAEVAAPAISPKRASAVSTRFIKSLTDEAQDALDAALMGVEVSRTAEGHLTQEFGESLAAALSRLGKMRNIGGLDEGAWRATFKELGAALPEGLAQGIEAGEAPATSAGNALALSVIKAVKASLGIASPSEEARVLGENFGKSFAGAIATEVDAARAAGATLGAAAQAGIAGAFDSIGPAIRDALNDIVGRGGVGTKAGITNLANDFAFAFKIAVRDALARGERLGISEIFEGTDVVGATKAVMGGVPPEERAAQEQKQAAAKQVTAPTKPPEQKKQTVQKQDVQQQTVVKTTAPPGKTAVKPAPAGAGGPLDDLVNKVAANVEQQTERLTVLQQGFAKDLARTTGPRGQTLTAQQQMGNLLSGESSVWANIIMQGITGELREALEILAATRPAESLAVWRHRVELGGEAQRRQMDQIMEAAGAAGFAPGTNIGGSTKMGRVLVEGGEGPLAANRIVRNAQRRGGGATKGTGITQRDFTGQFFQEAMENFVPTAFAEMMPGTKEWDAVLKNFSPLTKEFPWQGKEVKAPKEFAAQSEQFGEAVDAAIQKIFVERFNLAADDLPAMARRLGSKTGGRGLDKEAEAQFTRLFRETPELAQFERFGPSAIAQQIQRRGRAQQQQERFVTQHGDPQMEAVTSEIFANARKAIVKLDTIEEVIGAMQQLDVDVRKMFADKFAAGEGDIFKALSERPDPVLTERIKQLQKFAATPVKEGPGETLGEQFNIARAARRKVEELIGGSFSEVDKVLGEFQHARNIQQRPRMTQVQAQLAREAREAAAFTVGTGLPATRGGIPEDRTVRVVRARRPQFSAIGREARLRDLGGSVPIVTAAERAAMEGRAATSEMMGKIPEPPMDASKEALKQLSAQYNELGKSMNEADAQIAKLTGEQAAKTGQSVAEVNEAIQKLKAAGSKGRGTKAQKDIIRLSNEMVEFDRQRQIVFAQIGDQQTALSRANAATMSAALKAGVFRQTGKGLEMAGRRRPALFGGERITSEAQNEMLSQGGEALRGASLLRPIQTVDQQAARRRARSARLREAALARERLTTEQPIDATAMTSVRLDQFQKLADDYGKVISFASETFNKGWKQAWESVQETSKAFFSKAGAQVAGLAGEGAIDADTLADFNQRLTNAQQDLGNITGRVAQGKKFDRTGLTAFKNLADDTRLMAAFIADAEKLAQQAIAEAQRVATTGAQGGAANIGNLISGAVRRKLDAGDLADTRGMTVIEAQRAAAPAVPDVGTICPCSAAIRDGVSILVKAIARIKVDVTPEMLEAITAGAAKRTTVAGGSGSKDDEASLARIRQEFTRKAETTFQNQAFTAQRLARGANDLDKDEIKRIFDLIARIQGEELALARKELAVKERTLPSGKVVPTDRRDIIDAFRQAMTRFESRLQKEVGAPANIRAITAQRTVTPLRMDRAQLQAMSEVTAAQRAAESVLRASGAPQAQVEKGLLEVADAAEVAKREIFDLAGVTDKTFQEIDARIDKVVIGFRELASATKQGARLADLRPAIRAQTNIAARGESIESRLAGARAAVAGATIAPADEAAFLSRIDAAATAASQELDRLKVAFANIAPGAEGSLASLNQQLRAIGAQTRAVTDAVKEEARAMSALEVAALKAAKASQAAATGAASPTNLGFDTKRTKRAIENEFSTADKLAARLVDAEGADQTRLQELMGQIARIRQDTERMITSAVQSTAGQDLQDQASAINDATRQLRNNLELVTTELRTMDKTANGLEGTFDRINSAAAGTFQKLNKATQAASGTVRKDVFAPAIDVDFGNQIRRADKQIQSAANEMVTKLDSLIRQASEAARAGNVAQVKLLVQQIRDLGAAAENAVEGTLARIRARSDAVEAQVERIEQFRKFAADPQAFLQERTIGRAKQGGLGGIINRGKLGLQEVTAMTEMFAAVAKAREQFTAWDVVLRPVLNTLNAIASTVKVIALTVSAPIWLPFIAAMKAVQGAKAVGRGIGGLFGGKGGGGAGGLPPALEELPGGRKARQARNADGTFAGAATSAGAVGRAAAASTPPVRKLVDTITLGATKASTSVNKLTTDITEIGGAAGKATAQRGMKKIFADMGTGVGLGFGMSFSMGIINAIQGIGWRIQSTIAGIVTGGFAAVVETEMRKMTIRSFVAQDLTESASGAANFAQIWEDAGVAAEDYYSKITTMAKKSSFSRAPLLDLFGNMQVGGLTASNAEQVTRAVAQFGDAFMPGNKQMVATFGQQMMQMLNQGVAQQADLKLLAMQGIPVYKLLAENLQSLRGLGPNEAQGKIFEGLEKGQIGATEALEAIIAGMVKASEQFKGKAATTFTGMISTFQDLMLETSEKIMQPVAENLFKPFIELGNDLLQSDVFTKAIDAFGQKILQVSQMIQDIFATSLGVVLGLWNSLPAGVQEGIKAFGLATVAIAGLTAAFAGLAAISALLAPVLSIVSGGMLAAAAGLGTAITLYTTNFMGFRDWITTFMADLGITIQTLGQTIAWGLLEAVGTVSQFGANIINGFLDNFMANAEAIYTVVFNWGQGVAAAIGAGLETVASWAQAAVDWLWALPNGMNEILGAIGAWFSNLGANFGAALTWLVDWVTNFIEILWTIPENMAGIVDAMFDFGAAIVQVFADGMQSAINVVFDALQAIGNMFTEWLEPGSPPRLLPDLDKWGTAAADVYLQGWTKADFGIFKELSGKLEESLAVDEGDLAEGQFVAIRNAIAEMVGQAVDFGTADISGIMAAFPGWGGRAEQVARLSQAYADFAVSQHALVVEQEALDKITAQYDARLVPLQNKLKSLQNKQEDLDLGKQLKEWQRVMDNVFASDAQKAAAKLKIDELKLTKQINDIEMERDDLTDPINDRIAALTVENQEAQRALDLANERWQTELDLAKATQGKEGKEPTTPAEKAEKAKKEKAAAAEKNRQFEQPKLDVPAFSATKSLGAIAEKAKDVSDKISGYFKDMADKAQPLVDAISGIGGAIDEMGAAINRGMASGAFTAEGGFSGFLNNIGVVTASAIGFIDGVITKIDALKEAWNNPFGTATAKMGPKTKEEAGGFGGFDDTRVITLETRLRAVVDELSVDLNAAKQHVVDFGTGVKTAMDEVDWAQLQTDVSLGLGGAATLIRGWASGIPQLIADALKVDLGDDPWAIVSNLDAGGEKNTTGIARAAADFATSVSDTIGLQLQKFNGADEGAAGLTAGAIIFTAEMLKNINVGILEFVASSDFTESAKGVGKQLGEIIAGLVVGALFGGAFVFFESEEMASLQTKAINKAKDVMLAFMDGLIWGIIGVVAEKAGVPPEMVEGAKGFVKETGEVVSEATSAGGVLEGPAKVAQGIQQVSANPVVGLVDVGLEIGKGIANIISPPAPERPVEQRVDPTRPPGAQAVAPVVPVVPARLTTPVAEPPSFRSPPVLGPAPRPTMGPKTREEAGAAPPAVAAPPPVLTNEFINKSAESGAMAWAATFGSELTPALQGANIGQLTWAAYSTELMKWAGDDTAKKNYVSIGAAIASGMDAGVVSAITKAQGGTMVGAPTALIEYYKSQFGIKSPSTVFQEQIGVPIGQGILAGIKTGLVGEEGGPGEVVNIMYNAILASTATFALNMNVAWLNLKTRITGTLKVLSDEWMGVFEDMYKDLNEAFDKFSDDWVEDKWPALKDAVIDLAEQMKEGVLSVMDELVSSMGDKLGELLAAVQSDELKKGFADAGASLGESLVGGIVDAMTSGSAQSEWSSMAEDVIADIISALEEEAGAASPSKVSRDQVGLPLAQGIAVGLTMPKATRYFDSAASNVIEKIIHSFGGQTAPMLVANNYVGRRPEENLQSYGSGNRTYILNLAVTPQQAQNVEYNYRVLELMS